MRVPKLPAQLRFQGRTNRAAFWGLTLGTVTLASVTLLSLALIASPDLFALTQGGFKVQLIAVLMLAVFFGAIGFVALAAVRRLHDQGNSGLWLIVYAVAARQHELVGMAAAPLPELAYHWETVVFIAFVVHLLRPGTPGPNRYGPEPTRSPI
jgi:uncharacterized membrane protein YhaH (DUF805 family)